MKDLYGENYMNVQVMELDTRYMNLVVEDANRHGFKCPGCGASAWAMAEPHI
jgi:transcription initiation factor IIE alpha subunit